MRQHSGRFLLRVPPDLHQRLRGRAARDGLSLNGLCVRLLDTGLSAEAAAPSRRTAAVDPDLLEAIAREWVEELVGIAHFGSTARGDATERSDIDLLVVLDGAARIERSHYDRWDRVVASRGTRADDRVSPHFVALPSSPEAAGGVWLEVAREGIILDDRAGRLARFLIELRDLVTAGTVYRKKIHGHPYWVREERPR